MGNLICSEGCERSQWDRLVRSITDASEFKPGDELKG